MLVGVDMVKLQARCGESLELCRDFMRKLLSNTCKKENRSAGTHHVVAKISVWSNQVGNRSGWQHWTAIDEHKMQTDPEARHLPGPRHRVGGGWRSNHQARGGENAVAVCKLDRFVDFDGGTKIVRRYDKTFQAAASSLCRRNWKNSTPSRRRRLIISGLVIISPKIEAIFDGRK